MKKSVLKEIVQNIIAQKLLEAKTGKPSKFGYIISGKGTEDPTLQMNGFGNMTKSAWKKKIEHDVKDLLARVQADDWSGAVYYLQQNGVLHSAINMMDEVLSDPKLKEQLAAPTADGADVAPVLNTGTPSDRNSVELAKEQKKLTDLTNHIKVLEASIAKRMDAINKANQKDERQKEMLTKRQAPVIHKIDQLKKKVDAANPKDTQLTEITDNKPAVRPSYQDVKVGDVYISSLPIIRVSTVLSLEPISTRFNKPDRIVTVKIVAFASGNLVDEKKKIWVSQLLQGLV